MSGREVAEKRQAFLPHKSSGKDRDGLVRPQAEPATQMATLPFV